MTTVTAKEYLDPQGAIVASGERLAEAVLPVVKKGESVTIDFNGMPAISSSYFNIFFLKLLLFGVGREVIDRIEWKFVAPFYQRIYERSKAAAFARQESRS
jgi:hypothetical protein